MNQPNLQRMVVVFLAFALIAGSSAFFFSNFNFSSNPTPDKQTSGPNVAVESLNSVTQGNSDNAFANSPNLTNLIANNLAGQIKENNPDGPQQSGNGYVLNMPSDALVENTVNQILSQNKINIDEKISESDIKISQISSSTPQEIANYLSSFSSILDELSSNKNLNNLVDKPDSGPELNAAARTAYKTTFEKLLAITVPEPLKNLHLGMLKVLADQKMAFDIAGNYQTDPVKSFLAIQNAGNILLRDLKEMDSTTKQTGESQPKIYSLFDSFWKKIAFVDTAYAQTAQTPSAGVPATGGNPQTSGSSSVACNAVSNLSAPVQQVAGKAVTNQLQNDINTAKNMISQYGGYLSPDQLKALQNILNAAQTTVPVTVQIDKSSASAARNSALDTQVAHQECSWIYGFLLQQIKSILLDQLQNQIVSWIQGGGTPQFITNWSGFLGQVANEALGNTLYEIDPHLCSGFAPLVNIALSPPSYAYTPVQCTLTQVIGNLQQLTNFYNDFSVGGWNAYGAVLQVNNNPFGILIEGHDIALQKEANAVNSANSQAIASQGFLSTTKCTAPEGSGYTDANCPPEYKKIVTPGAYIGHVLAQSANFIPQEIISADRFEQLLTAISDALINKVISGAGGFLGVGVSSNQEVINQYQSSYSGLLNQVTPAILTTIEITPSVSTVAPLDTLQLSATTLDQNNNPIDATVAWTSSNDSIATVDPNTGLVTGVSVGTVTITAQNESVSGTASVTVITSTTPTSTKPIFPKIPF